MQNIGYSEDAQVPRSPQTIDELVAGAVADAIRKVMPAVQRHIAALAAEQLESALALDGGARRSARPRARTRVEITKWVADKNARRVPNFVIDATGLDTKKKIVARFGENATFEKGKPPPKPARAA